MTNRIVQTLIVDWAKERILLAYHKGGAFVGSYTGLLGYAKDEEEIEDAALRVAMELSGLILQEIELRAILTFIDSENGDEDEYEFFCERFSGEVQESESTIPEWFPISEIPYHKMPADDSIWYPPFLEGRKLCGRFNLSPDTQELLSYDLNEVGNL